MKKILLALAFASLGTTAALAQEYEIPQQKYSVATNSFWANWFISAGISGNAFYTSQEAASVKGNPFSDKRGTLGFTIAIGKWFTPGIGLRTKFDGVWGKQVNTENNHPIYNMVNLHEDVMFNLSNMFCGYNEKRVWNFIPYVGLGWVRNTDTKADEISYHFGLLNNFRVSKRVQLFADLSLAAYEGSIDGSYKSTVTDNWASYGKFKAHHWDKKLSLELGVTYNLGKYNWEKTPDVDALMAMNKEQMDALNQSLKEQQDENARLRDMLEAANEKETPVVQSSKEFVGTSASVFFNINSAKIASRKDLVNVKELAEYAKNNDVKIVVTGYADSKTGSNEYNQQLSLKRAETVANELVKMGVNRDNIITEAKGGVANLSPFSYNRRATVKIQ